MNKFFSHPALLWVLRLILAGVFLYAGVLKIIKPQEFADNIAQYQLLPEALINIIALSLPFFECAVGLLLLSGKCDRLASGGIILMCLVFGVALISAIARGLVIDCGCFGSSEPSKWSAWWALGRDILLLIGALWLYILEYTAALKD